MTPGNPLDEQGMIAHLLNAIPISYNTFFCKILIQNRKVLIDSKHTCIYEKVLQGLREQKERLENCRSVKGESIGCV
jgi:hypothetical protein